MPRYFFDIRDGGTVAIDKEGLGFAALEAVQEEAARSLVKLVRNSL